jgi:hypothetical protein
VAVQVAGGVKPVIVKSAVSAGLSVAVASFAVTVPLEQVTPTVTAELELSEKSFDTLSVALFSVLMIVQDDVPPIEIDTLAQPLWLAV